ncbi:hypothetical protein E143388_01179 [Rhodococcus opacus]|nr:hypothetical protein E143388_01179 [Rhodococcus opacus]
MQYPGSLCCTDLPGADDSSDRHHCNERDVMTTDSTAAAETGCIFGAADMVEGRTVYRAD